MRSAEQPAAVVHTHVATEPAECMIMHEAHPTPTLPRMAHSTKAYLLEGLPTRSPTPTCMHMPLATCYRVVTYGRVQMKAFKSGSPAKACPIRRTLRARTLDKDFSQAAAV